MPTAVGCCVFFFGATIVLSIGLALSQTLRLPPPTGLFTLQDQQGVINGIHWHASQLDNSTRRIQFSLPLANFTIEFPREFEVYVPPMPHGRSIKRIMIDSPGYETTRSQEEKFSPLKRRAVELEAIVVTTTGPTDVFDETTSELYGGWNAWGWSDNELPTISTEPCTSTSMCNDNHEKYPCYVSQIASVQSTGKCTKKHNSATCSTMSKQNDIHYMRLVISFLEHAFPERYKIIMHGQSIGGIISEAAFQQIHRIDGAIGVSSGAAFNRGVPMRRNEDRPLLHYHGVLDQTIPTCLNASFVVNDLFPNAGLQIGEQFTSFGVGVIPRLGEKLSDVVLSAEMNDEPYKVHEPVRPNCTDALGNPGCLSYDNFIYGSLQTLYDQYRTGKQKVRLEDAPWKTQPLTGLDLNKPTVGANVACTNATKKIRLCLVTTNHLLPYMVPFTSTYFVQGEKGENLYVNTILAWLKEHDL